MQPYSIPSETCRTEIIINKSRFITTLGYASTVEDARQFISDIKAEMSDANHHVYAFRVGYANSVIEGMSDDGEPTGTSGPPTLAVIRGADIGDIVCVTTRYFGGKKLGTGGLVKAYTESAQTALESLQTELRVTKIALTARIPYSLYNIIENYISSTDISIEDKVFTEDVTLTLELLESQQADFVKTLVDMTHGQVQFID